MTEATIMGVSDAELAALIVGRWQDGRTRGWKRWAESEDEQGDRMVFQQLFPSLVPPRGWAAYSRNERKHTDSLDEALRWCDDQVEGYKIAVPSGVATKQQHRFVE